MQFYVIIGFYIFGSLLSYSSFAYVASSRR
jgi:hypothetical protein